MNFVPLLLVHLHHTAYAGNVDDRELAYSANDIRLTGSVILLQHQILPASSKVYHMNFVPAASSFVQHTACTGYVDDRVVASQPRDSMLTAGL
jgi:hypothetical protein